MMQFNMATVVTLIFIFVIIGHNGAIPINILDKKITMIKHMLELEIEMLRYDLTQLGGNLSNVVHGLREMPGYNRTGNLSQKSDVDLATFEDNTIGVADLYKVLAQAFKAEKMALKKNNEETCVHLKETAEELSGIKAILSSHELDVISTETQVRHMLESEGRRNIAMIEVQSQLQSFNEKLDSLTKNVSYTMEYLMNESKYDFETFRNEVLENNKKITTLETTLQSNRDFYDAKLNETREIVINKSREDDNNIYQILGLSPPVVFAKTMYIQGRKNMNFQDATEFCKKMSAHLPEVERIEENAFLSNTFRDIFLGGTDLQTEGQWKWAHSGTSIPLKHQTGFQNWHPDEPNNVGGNENCLHLRYTGYWNDLSCDRLMTVVCEF